MGRVHVSPSASGKGDHKIPSLDGFRALAIAMVFLSHALPETGRISIPGGFGVTVFFFLSGYLITTLLRREYDAAGTLNFGGFYIRRVLRIYPPLLACLLLSSVLSAAHALPHRFDPMVLAVAMLQLSNYWMLAHGVESLGPGVGVLWSLAVEEHFYLFFPFLYLLLRRRLPSALDQAKVLWGLCALLLAWRFVLTFALHGSAEHLRLATDTRLDSILFGSGLAIFGNPMLDRTAISKPVWTWALLPLGLAALLASHAIPGEGMRECLKYTVEGVALIPVFCAAIRFPGWGPLRALNWRPVAFFGVLSYSYYLVHAMLLRALETWVPRGDPRMMIAGFAAALALAWLMHVGVELPSNRVRRSLSAARPASAPRPRAAEMPAAEAVR